MDTIRRRHAPTCGEARAVITIDAKNVPQRLRDRSRRARSPFDRP